MLDPVGNYHYQLAHVEIPYDSLHFPSWPDTLSYDSVVIFSSTPDTTNIPTDTVYDVKMCEITGTYSYAGLGFNTADSLYVWGNSGVGLMNSTHRGMANLLPNWSEKWCGVTSGLLGNQGTIIHSGHATDTNIGVPGIHHSYSTEVTCHSYQYQLFKHGDTTVYAYLPDSTKLGLGYTVFGATKFTLGVAEAVPAGQFSIWPSIASTDFNVAIVNSEMALNFTLYDVLGRAVFEQNLLPGTDHIEVPVSDLPSGMYLGCLTSQSNMEEAKIIVQH